jgi:ketosteroid isomerase-like protein
MKYSYLVPLVVLLISCQSENNKNQHSLAKEKSKIEAVMKQQESDWNNGNLEGYMQAYWKSDSMLFIGKRGLNYGWQTTLDNYRKSYANPTQMGQLIFDNQELKLMNQEHAWAAGKWKLLRKADTLNGSYMLIWKKKKGEWRIIADHSS